MKNIGILLCFFWLSSCQNNTQQSSSDFFSIKGETQGTTYSISYKSNEDLSGSIDSMLQSFNKIFSNYDSLSIIEKINKRVIDTSSNQLFLQCMSTSKTVCEETNGAFDISIKPLISVWQTTKKQKKLPRKSLVDSVLKNIGCSSFSLDDNKISFESTEVQITSNAIAQGLAVDYISDFIEHQGVNNYMVEIGGEVRAHGLNKKEQAWQIGIDKPIDSLQFREIQAIISLQNKSIATSGNYRNYFELQGIKYSHIIDPRTGYPVQNEIVSASIITEKCMNADAYATACVVLGLEKCKALVKQNQQLECYILYTTDSGTIQSYISDNIRALVNEKP